MKVDTQIEDNCRRTISYLQGYSCPKTSVTRNWLIRNLRRIQFAIQEEQLYAECGTRYLSKLLCIFSSLFTKNLNKARYNIYGNLLPVLALKVPVLRRNKATNSSTSTDPFSTATKTLAKVIYSSLKDLPSHSHGHFAIGDNKKNKTIAIFFSIVIPKWQTSRANVMSSLKTLNKFFFTALLGAPLVNTI